MTLLPDWFIKYKFLNSLFLGISVGSIFTIYSPLPPSIYSVGGIVLAVGMLVVARLYTHIMNIKYFFIISLVVELLLLLAMLYFIWKPYTYQTALIIYIGYQATFVFGSYLMRAETIILGSDALLTKVDTAKQFGYLLGMGLSYLFYKLMAHQGITQSETQVYYLHFILIGIETIIILLVFKSFQRD